jgi:hypothetical protein
LRIDKTEKSRKEWEIAVEGADHRIHDIHDAFEKLARNRPSLDPLKVSELRERSDSTYG